MLGRPVVAPFASYQFGEGYVVRGDHEGRPYSGNVTGPLMWGVLFQAAAAASALPLRGLPCRPSMPTDTGPSIVTRRALIDRCGSIPAVSFASGRVRLSSETHRESRRGGPAAFGNVVEGLRVARFPCRLVRDRLAKPA